MMKRRDEGTRLWRRRHTYGCIEISARSYISPRKLCKEGGRKAFSSFDLQMSYQVGREEKIAFSGEDR